MSENFACMKANWLHVFSLSTMYLIACIPVPPVSAPTPTTPLLHCFCKGQCAHGSSCAKAIPIIIIIITILTWCTEVSLHKHHKLYPLQHRPIVIQCHFSCKSIPSASPPLAFPNFSNKFFILYKRFTLYWSHLSSSLSLPVLR